MGKKKKIDIIVVIDRSGTMARDELYIKSTSAFNEYIQTQKNAGLNARVTLRIFDNRHDVLYKNKDLKDVKELDPREVYPRNMTALHDAFAMAMLDGEIDRPTICYLMTDGLENYSMEHDAKSVSALREEREAAGWDFMFFGAGISADEVSRGYGLKKEKKVTIAASSAGMATRTAAMNKSTADYAMLVEDCD